MDEPSLACPDWKATSQAAVNAIRAVDPRTPIAVPGRIAWVWDWNTDVRRNQDTREVTGTYLAFEGHQYPDHDSSGQFLNSYDSWMATVSQWGLADINDFHLSICKTLPPATGDRFFDWLRIRNLRGFLGETGMPSEMRWHPGSNSWGPHHAYYSG